MADEEALAKLKEGNSAWNAWCKENEKSNPEFIPNLNGADLKQFDFRGRNLGLVDLEKADLSGANLQGVNLYLVNLRNAILIGANLQSANLEDSDLRGANFARANLQEVNLILADMRGANLTGANCQGADFTNANLKRANLRDVNLINTNLSYAKSIAFNDNKIRNSVITSTTTSPWLALKKNYTNTMMLFHIVGVLAFFLPYIVNVVVWRSLNLAQELNLIEMLNGQIGINKCFSESCTSWRIWELLIGLRRGAWFAFLSTVLIPYNILRIVLTQQVSILKDSEQATGITPTHSRAIPESYDLRFNTKLYMWWIKIWDYRHGYRILFRAHIVLQVIFFLAAASGIIHTIAWLRDVVELPTID